MSGPASGWLGRTLAQYLAEHEILDADIWLIERP